MIDHIIGRPNPSWKRTQVLIVILFWLYRILRGASGPPRFLWLRPANRSLKRFTPWQIILSTLTAVYSLRNLDKILGLSAPEPLARLYTPSFYRATWITTGLDAGFATAMSIRPKWLRDICSIIFSIYYIIYANEADEKLRRFRAVPTVEMLRATWEKTTNPYIRFITHLQHVSVKRKLFIPRPKASTYTRPISAYLFFHPPDDQLCKATDLILDFPGGGFVAMNPEHHEERLRIWAATTQRPVLSIDYGKAPEYPYPFAVDEAFDVYKTLVETAGRCIGMSGRSLRIIVSGDSAGASLAVNVVTRILESANSSNLPWQEVQLLLPIAVVLNYPALDFNFTSWMSKENLRVLRTEQSSGNLPGLEELAMQKNHLQHISPLSMVSDKRSSHSRSKHLKRRTSWKDTLRALTSSLEKGTETETPSAPSLRTRHTTGLLKSSSNNDSSSRRRNTLSLCPTDENGILADAESEDEGFQQWKEEDRPIQARVLYSYTDLPVSASGNGSVPGTPAERSKNCDGNLSEPINGMVLATSKKVKEPIGTRLTMTSRTGYFQDRIISPSMMRAMAIMYIGPHRNPDFTTDYHISPILTPSHLLAQFPPLLMQCGERDPFVDDTVIFAGRIREAKRARRVEIDLLISGKSARFGEGLRMSRTEGSFKSSEFSTLESERDRLVIECENDWVQMDLFSDWSHGYLQMPTLMSEAKAVIQDLAEWMNAAFGRFGAVNPNASVQAAEQDMFGTRERTGQMLEGSSHQSPFTSASETETETDEPGITFIAKKYHVVDEISRTSSSDSQSRNRRLSAIRHGLQQVDNVSPAGSDSRTLLVNGENVEHKPTTPRQAGQTITETELMRRRRLLDSHIFD
ncbi:hypothetical protein AMATHDRAFT_54355 [Amanita thiersii Skay4041]|uniref:Alpha/beta hydrolase fold-3 domain-containing protein n=1 Tax=Amanita thiersii Skay4041 TaxID=703135 RepID=A0A2A9P043_9AGAR|nr:hypothetical protein AMATHDRAFT_54355 [Amanita thiersii Skay4041]